MVIKNQGRAATCAGCGCLFKLEGRNNRLFCDFRCRERSRYGHRQVQFADLPVSAIPFGQAEIRFRETLYSRVPKGADGYSLYCFELELSFPMMGTTRRYTGHKRAEPFFLLWPFEPPLVPLDARYGLQWLTQGHVMEMTGTAPETISVSFAQPTNHVLLRRLVAQWKRAGAKVAVPEQVILELADVLALPHPVEPSGLTPEGQIQGPAKS